MLIKEIGEGNELNKLLSSFSCNKDKDIEYFLQNRAVEFEKLSKARTYLVFDQDELEKNDPLTPLTIYGYISVALKILSVPDYISNRMRREIDGYSAKIHGEQIKDFPCYLIGQLAKNSNVEKYELAGNELINLACDVIATSVEAVGGRYIMIECREENKLIQFYEENLFSEIARIPDNEQPMVQMIRKIM